MEIMRSDRFNRNYLVTNDGRALFAKIGKPELLRPGYHFTPIGLKEPLAPVDEPPTMDGALYTLKQKIATNPALVTEPAILEDTVIKGSAIFLGLNPLDHIVEYRIHESDGISVRYGLDWFITWIAGREGATILGTSTPPFTDNMELTVPMFAATAKGRKIPHKYWELWHRYINPNY